jgi:hypothetical protein
MLVNAAGGGVDGMLSELTIASNAVLTMDAGEVWCSSLFLDQSAVLNANGGNKIRVFGNATISGDITYSAGFTTGTVLQVSNNLTVNGSIGVGAATFSTNYIVSGILDLNPGSEVRYLASGDQTINSSLVYHSLSLEGSGNKTISSALTVHDEFTIADTARLVNNNRNVSCGSNLINNSTASHAFGTGTYTFTGTTIGGTQATDLSGATVNFSGSSIVIGDHSIGDGAVTFSNVNFTNTNSSVVVGANAYAGTVTFGGALNLSGDNASLTVQSGTVAASGITVSGSNSVVQFSGGSVSVSGNIIAGNALTILTPTTVGGSVDVGGNFLLANTLNVTGATDVLGTFAISGTSAAGSFAGLVTASGSVVNIAAGTNVFSGGLTHNSTAIGSSCTIGGSYSVGPTGTAATTLNAETISFTGQAPDFHTLVISNPSGSATSTVPVSIRSTVSLAKDLVVSGATLTFAATAPLVSISGTGEIVGAVRRTLSALGSYTFNGTQATLQVPALSGSEDYVFVLVKSAPDAQAVSRYYDIERISGDLVPPAYTYTLGLQYRDAELNGNTENALLLACGDLYLAGENQFAKVTSSNVQTTSNTVTYHFDGIMSLNHRYTLADLNAPLPVELTAFAARRKDDVIALRWSTATELNNYGFEVERADRKGGDFVMIGFVEGVGTSSTAQEYAFTDDSPGQGSRYYRLRQVDRDGTSSYSPVVEVHAETAPMSISNYPNPFNPTTTITFTAANDGHAVLKVYDAVGREVALLHDAAVRVGESVSVPFEAGELPGGTYFYTLAIGESVTTGKMLLTK